MEDYSITAIVAVPHDHKSATLLLGRYVSGEEEYQIVQPNAVVGELLATVVSVQGYVIAAVLVVGVAALASAGLVFALSLRLRVREIETLSKIGGSRPRIGALLAAETVLVLAAGMVLAAVLSWITQDYGTALIRSLVLK